MYIALFINNTAQSLTQDTEWGNTIMDSNQDQPSEPPMEPEEEAAIQAQFSVSSDESAASSHRTKTRVKQVRRWLRANMLSIMVAVLLMKMTIIYTFDSCSLANDDAGSDNAVVAWVLTFFSLFEFLGICFVSFKFVFQEKAHQVNQCWPTGVEEFRCTGNAQVRSQGISVMLCALCWNLCRINGNHINPLISIRPS